MVEPGCWSMNFPRSYPKSSNKFELWVAASTVNSNWKGELEGAGAVDLATDSTVL